MDVNSTSFAIAFLGGLVPALFWLWFWLREDKERPEPYSLIALAFISGMLVVPIALPLQKWALEMYTDQYLILIWVIIEEVLKYAVALLIILWHKAVDEPIDLIIYMITIALGFSALENGLFMFNPLIAGDVANSVITGFFRFLGATLLHVLASGTVGAFLALTFYKHNFLKLLSGTIGLFIAIVLHALFNFFIMDASGETILGVFLFVWMGIIVLFIVFEKVKLIEASHLSGRSTKGNSQQS
ncbi:PrsW family intramembrane metalloprotease [Candidatus Kaiserbacteria bacterium]|nr:PrsW family intramembrane metalloprotease [Candidatus Kaiserbacteria bacterium]MCB9811303.1 PrsW family intramembrane metalloprotease [Candidatus Nomurabacteria bacterium]